MITPYKGRTFYKTQPVEVYRCLTRKGKVYSVRQNGVVVGHTEYVTLKDCTFVVNKAGQDRCRFQGKRNVHAYILGYVDDIPFPDIGKSISYNPYEDSGFTDGSGLNILHAKWVSISDKGVLV